MLSKREPLYLHMKHVDHESYRRIPRKNTRVKGSVYRGIFNRNFAEVNIMKGDVSGEIHIVKHINHSDIIRLSGFCLHQGNTYLVYEFAEKGSLSDRLHSTN
ncbi:hypothetical protein L1887_10241 [Cichorium endivia]|nr:hypothetical protein L1887_10241 [Cichorium endivia]